jgi:hypothetical protein
MKDSERITLGEVAAKFVDDKNALATAQMEIQAAVTAQLVRESYPDIDDDSRAMFCHGIAYLLANLGTLKLMEAADTIEAMLATYSVAAAVLAGVYEVGGETQDEAEEHMRAVSKHMKKARKDRGESPDPLMNTGQYL